MQVGLEFDATAEPSREALDAFLQQIALVADADSRRDEDSLVTLMTLHNAKGLEYPIVFVVGCEDGIFPHSRALDEGGVEEERRLFYVGVTRAMRQLYLTYARRRSVFGAPTAGLPSRFLDEIPSELTDFEEQPVARWGSRTTGGTAGGRGGGRALRGRARSTPRGGGGAELEPTDSRRRSRREDDEVDRPRLTPTTTRGTAWTCRRSPDQGLPSWPGRHAPGLRRRRSSPPLSPVA